MRRRRGNRARGAQNLLDLNQQLLHRGIVGKIKPTLRGRALSALRRSRASAEIYVVNSPRVGAQATVLRCGGPKCVLAKGRLAGQQGFTVSIALEHSAQALEPGQEVVVACGPAGHRLALLARFHEVRDGGAVFVRRSPWRPTDTRAFPRFATSLDAIIAATDILVRAKIVDISLGGMAIEAEQPVDADSVLARIDDGDESSPPLPCNVVRKRRDGERIQLHVEFGVLSSESSAFVERLVREASLGPQAHRLAS